MKKKIFALFMALTSLGFVYSPARAKPPVENNHYGFVKNAGASASKQVLYIRHRGRLYRVRYYRDHVTDTFVIIAQEGVISDIIVPAGGTSGIIVTNFK